MGRNLVFRQPTGKRAAPGRGLPPLPNDEDRMTAAMRRYTRARFRVAVIGLEERLRPADHQVAVELLDELAAAASRRG